MMTTLTSVGFGDIRPYNTYERILCIIIFLFVLTAFSGVTGYMQDLLAHQSVLTSGAGDHKSLQRFLGVLERFNNNNPLTPEFIHNIEDYFEFYWETDKMNFIKDPKDRQMLLELPANYRTTVMKDFLF